MDWRELRVRDWLLFAAIVAVGLATAVFVPAPGGLLRWLAPNNGFDAGWRCTPQVDGDPVCVKPVR